MNRPLKNPELRATVLRMIIDNSGYFFIGNRFAAAELGMGDKTKEISELKVRVDQLIDDRIKKLNVRTVNSSEMNVHAEAILKDCILYFEKELPLLMDKAAFAKVRESINNSPGGAYPKRYALQRYHISNKIESIFRHNNVDIVRKPPFSMPFSVTLLTACPTMQRLLNLSEEQKVECREMIDALFVEIFFLKSEYESSTFSSTGEVRQQFSRASFKLKSLIDSADNDLNAKMPVVHSRAAQLRMQLIGDGIILFEQDIVTALSITENQLKQFNSIRRDYINRSLERAKSGQRTIEKTYIGRYEENMQFYQVLNDKQKELWNKKIGSRLSEKDYVKLQLEYREIVK